MAFRISLQILCGVLSLLPTQGLAAAQNQTASAAASCRQLQAVLGNVTFVPSQSEYLALSEEN